MRTKFNKTDVHKMIGNDRAVKHGIYRQAFTAEEESERLEYERELIQDLGGHPTVAQKTLIRRASFMEMRLRRSEQASNDGWALPDAVILAWINAQRLALCALGLERRNHPAPDLSDIIREIEEEKIGQRHLV